MPRISYRKKLWIKKVLRIGLILLAVALVAAGSRCSFIWPPLSPMTGRERI